jgi:tetratricopeptide (TPR) repeat protein
MSKKRPKRKDVKPNGGSQDSSDWMPPPDPQIFDPRQMERLMHDLTRMLSEQEFESEEEMNDFLQRFMESNEPIPRHKAETPLEKAQELIYEAWETESPRKRVRLARKALRISPDCVDAYLILAEETAESLEEAREFYEQAVEAGERALGPDALSDLEGNFWLATETRPYMRARLELAQLLWFMDEAQEAIDELHEMLLLNPNDNQGARYILLSYLLQDDRNEEAEKLLDDFKEDASPDWLYTHALILFIKQGPSRGANSTLKKALKSNPYVPEFLLGREPVPEDLPQYSTPGEPIEAAHYFLQYVTFWLRTRGAIDWLRDFAPES